MTVSAVASRTPRAFAAPKVVEAASSKAVGNNVAPSARICAVIVLTISLSARLGAGLRPSKAALENEKTGRRCQLEFALAPKFGDLLDL
ncbi:MAG: hypothetical protein NVS2B5_10770 [Beijerinckiaceae bacterium]